MTFHIPSIEAAEAVSGPEVAAARARGLYQLNWNHKAAQNSGAKAGKVSATNRRRSIVARLVIMQQIAAGNTVGVKIAETLGRTRASNRNRMELMKDEGLIEIHKDSQNAPIWASMTPAGREWLAQHGEA